METFFLHPQRERVAVFKSYYVVWKPKSNASLLSKLDGFKSYYVVWKQKEQALWRRKVRARLNRTM